MRSVSSVISNNTSSTLSYNRKKSSNANSHHSPFSHNHYVQASVREDGGGMKRR